MDGIAVLLDEPRVPIDAQFSITDRSCKLDDMSRVKKVPSSSYSSIFLTNLSRAGEIGGRPRSPV